MLSDDVVDARHAADCRPSGAIEVDAGDCVRMPIGTTMADAERELLLATLRHCGGNKRRTAEMLGVSLKTVYNKLVGQNGGVPAEGGGRLSCTPLAATGEPWHP